MLKLGVKYVNGYRVLAKYKDKWLTIDDSNIQSDLAVCGYATVEYNKIGE